jgi:hypothetical protein
MASADDDLLKQARKRWTRSADAENDQRKRILKAKQFRSGDQWEPAIKDSRAGAAAKQGEDPQPPRPCLVVDRLSQPLRQVSNTIKNASFGFDVLPNGGQADEETAKIFKGYLRWMQANSRDDSPLEWAADQAIEGGLGWFRLRTEYSYDTWDGPVLDPQVFWQELRMERIVNNLTVYCDPSATKPTRSDAQWMFVTEDISRDEFERKYPKADVAGLELFMATGDMGQHNQSWVSESTVRIAEYWRVTYSNRHFYMLQDGSVTEKKPDDKAQIKDHRIMRVPEVKCDKINAVQSLEQYDWVGTHIPIIPVIGEELNLDGRQYLRGVIEEGADAQRMVNYFYSGAVEIFALASKNAPMVPAGAVANYPQWKTRNIRNHAYLPYDPWSPDGQPYPAPILDTTEPPIQAAVELMRISEDAIKATTSTGDASLGNTNPNERSGRALQALQSQSDLANSNYPDNVRRALIYAAELALEVIPKITQPGQIFHILGDDDKTQQVVAGQPYLEGGKGQPPMPMPGVPPEVAKDPQTLYKFYDLNNGRYSVTVSVGKATATKREEGAAALGELIPHLPPPMAAVLTPEYIAQLQMPDAEKMAQLARKALPPELQAATQDGQQPNVPPEIQAQMEQMQQQNQQMQQALETKQVEHEASFKEAQLKADTELHKTQMTLDAESDRQLALQVMKNASAIAVAHIAAASKGADMQQHAAEEAQALGHEQEQNAMDRSHEANMAQLGHQQALEQGDQAHQQALQQGAQSGQQALEQGEQSGQQDQLSQLSDQAHQADMAEQAQAAAAAAPEQAGA